MMKKLFQRALSLILALLTVVTLLPVMDLPTEVQAVANEDKKPGYMGYAETAEQVYAIVKDYYDTVTANGKVYWNKDISTKNMKQKTYMSTVSSKANCDHGTTCKSNLFNGIGTVVGNELAYKGDRQCSAFSAYMAYVVFGKDRMDSNWQVYLGTQLPTDYEVKAGDQIRTNYYWTVGANPGHSRFIYKVENDIAYYIECNYDNKCGIRMASQNVSTIIKNVRGHKEAFLISSPIPSASELGTYKTNVEFILTGDANLYSEPYSTSNKVTTTAVPAGSVGVATQIQKNSQENYWYYVKINNTEGWIYGSYCDPLQPAADAIAVTTRTNLSQYIKSNTGISLKDTLKATGCTITAVTGAIRDANNAVVKNTEKVLQEKKATGSYSTFTANKDCDKVIDQLTPRKLTAGLYQYTLDVSLQMYTTDGKELIKTTYHDIRALDDWFEIHGGTASGLKVTFNANGGTCAQLEKVVYKDKDIGELPVPTKLGSTFQGWYTAQTGGTKVTATSTISQNTTLYARWQAGVKTYSIQYLPNGGAGTMRTSTAIIGQKLTLRNNAFTKASYVFTGWNTQANGSGTAYIDGQSVQNLTKTDKAVVSLYAQWRVMTTEEYLKTCTQYPTSVKVKAANSTAGLMTHPVNLSSGMVVRQLTSGETLRATAIYQNPSGEHWYQVTAEKDGQTGFVYAGNTTFDSVLDKTATYNVYLDTDKPLKGKINNINGSVSYQYGKVTALVGKLDDSDSSTSAQSQKITSGFTNIASTALNNKLSFGKLSAGPGTLTLTATVECRVSDGKTISWKSATASQKVISFTVIGSHAVTYKTNTTDTVENMPASQAKKDLTDLTLSKNVPVREGYIFLGWATTADAEKAEYQPGSTYTKNAALTLYALWQPEETEPEETVPEETVPEETVPDETVPDETLETYTVTYASNVDAGLPESQTKTQGEPLTLSDYTPWSQYYTFKGWQAEVDGKTEVFQPGDTLTVDADITLTALWEVSSYLYDASGGTYWELGESFRQVSQFDTTGMYHITMGFKLSDKLLAQYGSVDAWLESNGPSELGSWDFVPLQLKNGKLDFYVTPDTWITLVGDINCGYTFTRSEDIILDVQQLTLHGNGGLMDENDPFTDAVYSLYAVGHPQNTTVTAEFIRTGYTFMGWSTAPDSAQVVYGANIAWSQLDPSHTDLYAVWQAN